jgi:glycosyltransferase involved in cell wall biosynthesis
VFIWFGDYHSLLPVLFAKIFHKKSFVVIGGYDVSTLSEYKYGAFSNPIRAFFTQNTFKYVDICFPVAEALRKKLLLINPKTKAETIATSVYPEKFNFSDYERPKRIITISGTENLQRLMVKGLDRFRDLAIYLPEFEFVIIGASDTVKTYFEPVPINLILLPPRRFVRLIQYYQSASFYAQLSRSEGLPNALCEAMLCGCIPVGTNVGDIQITIGDAGMTIEDWNPEVLAEFIRLNHNNIQLRDRARNRIKTLYDPTKRIGRFRQLMDISIKK